MNLIGYFDESGTNPGDAYLTVAGYLSTQDRWDAFHVEWSAALKEYGLPFFHMTDCANGAPPYDRWAKEERWAMQQRMFRILSGHALCGMGCAVSIESYNRLVSPAADAKFPGPYGLAVRLMLDAGANTVAQLGVDNDPWIAYTFELGAEGSGKVFQAVNKLLPQLRRELRVLSLQFEPKDKFTPLQLGDIAAYELMRYVNTKYGVDQRYGPRTFNLEALGALVPAYWGRIKDELMLAWSSMAENPRFV